MKKINFFNGMEVYDVDFNQLQSYFEDRININMSTFTNKGVLVPCTIPNGITLNPPYVWFDNTSVGVYGLLAYDEMGHLIYVAPTYQNGVIAPTVSNLTPENDDGTGKLIQNGKGYLPNSEFYIVIRYAESYSQDELRTQAGTKIKLPVRIETGFELYSRAIDGILNGDVILAKIKTDVLGNISVDESVRTTFSFINTMVKGSLKGVTSTEIDTNNVTFDDHINMFGTGQWSITNPHAVSASDLGIDPAATGKHQFYLHSDGIKTKDMSSNTSALYPYYLSSTLTSEEKLIICPLSEALDEIVVANGQTFNPKNFPNQYNFDFSSYASEDFEGYYLFVVDSANKTIHQLGPYDSEEDTLFLSDLENRTYFPICSLYWGRPRYYVMDVEVRTVTQNPDGTESFGVAFTITCASTSEFSNVNGDGVIQASSFSARHTEPDPTQQDPDNVKTVEGTRFQYSGSVVEVTNISVLTANLNNYDIDPLTFRDRRVFNNTSFEDMRPEDLCALRDSAPLYDDTVKIYNARVISDFKSSYYSLGGTTGTTFKVTIDNSEFNAYTFEGEEQLSIDQVIEQLNGYFHQYYIGNGNAPVAMKNWEGKLMILAEKSITIETGTANSVLGFSEEYNNMTDLTDDIKCITTDGYLTSRQEIYYDSNGLIKDIYYITTGNYLRKHTISYNDDAFVKSVQESVVPLGKYI